jgi:O-antigen/teichoic acid export membrane protein
MKRHLYSLGRQTIVYGVSAAALQLVGVITLPVFARAFSPREYGAVEIATVGIGALLMLADAGMASASQRSYFDYGDDDAADRGTVLTTALATALAAASAIAALVILFREPIAGWLFRGADHVSLVVLVAVAVPLTILATFTREVMRLRFMAWSYTASAIVSATVSAAVGVYLVLETDAGPDGVVVGLVAGNAVAALYGLLTVARYLAARLSRRELRVMLAYGLPLIPAAAAMWGLAFLDRVMLSRLTDLDEVGQFAVGARVALVLMLCVTAFGLAYTPFMYSLFAEDRETEKQVRGRTLTYLTLALTAISLTLALFAREIIAVVAPDYDEGYRVVGILCLGVTIYGVSSVAMAGISLVRKTGYFALYSGVALVVNVALNLALIPPLGGVGAGLATATAYGCLTVLYYRRAQALYPTPYEPRKAVFVLVAGAALMPVGLLAPGLGAEALKLLALLLFAGAMLATGVLGRDEVTEVRDLARRFSRRTAASA